MENAGFNTPILFLVFNKVESTYKVFEQIRTVKPKKLYIAADGARPEKKDEQLQCKKVREVINLVNWDCEVFTLFREENLGCARAVSGAIDWFFENEKDGIIIEDDVYPEVSFFYFCEELLKKYKNDTRVMAIGSNNFFPEEDDCDGYSYYFSNMNFIWGWATWKRAWQYFDLEAKDYKKLIDTPKFKDNFACYYDYDYKVAEFKRNFKKMTAWSYSWYLARLANSGLFILPAKNLVINLGIGLQDATHTKGKQVVGHDLKLEGMDFPLKHPKYVTWDRERDYRFFVDNFTTPWKRMRVNIKRLLPGWFFKAIVYPAYRSVKNVFGFVQ